MHTNLLADPGLAFDEGAPRRVVSVVPSTTASLQELGLAQALVGISDYCPPVAGEPVRVGGPKTLDLGAIIALRPDLVIANREENSREDLEALAEAGVRVWLCFPMTVQAAVEDLWRTARLFRSQSAMQITAQLERSIEWARMASAEYSPQRCFCPVWEDSLPGGERWWMTFNQQTYPSDVLALFQLENPFAGRERRYPLAADLGHEPAEPTGERDTRYPRVSLAEIVAAEPEIILLPDEPYPYRQEHIQRAKTIFADTPAARTGRIFALDGRLLMWHGTYLAKTLEELPTFLAYSS